MLEVGELIAVRAHPEEVHEAGELVRKDSETPSRDLSGYGVTDHWPRILEQEDQSQRICCRMNSNYVLSPFSRPSRPPTL